MLKIPRSFWNWVFLFWSLYHDWVGGDLQDAWWLSGCTKKCYRYKIDMVWVTYLELHWLHFIFPDDVLDVLSLWSFFRCFVNPLLKAYSLLQCGHLAFLSGLGWGLVTGDGKPEVRLCDSGVLFTGECFFWGEGDEECICGFKLIGNCLSGSLFCTGLESNVASGSLSDLRFCGGCCVGFGGEIGLFDSSLGWGDSGFAMETSTVASSLLWLLKCLDIHNLFKFCIYPLFVFVLSSFK